MFSRQAFRGCWLAVSVCIATIGCSPRGPSPHGKVLFDDGEPVRSGSIEFRSLDDGQRYAGRIADDGAFVLRNKDDEAECPVGDYEVVVVQIVSTEDLAIDRHSHGRTVPRKYADYFTSGLQYSNDAERKEPITIELQSEQ
ncbi:MAG: carboxypeptidase regulatory-like domain-containing protein [Pirellulaceae bacterium]